jgi:hypothetical protein
MNRVAKRRTIRCYHHKDRVHAAGRLLPPDKGDRLGQNNFTAKDAGGRGGFHFVNHPFEAVFWGSTLVMCADLVDVSNPQSSASLCDLSG